MIFNRNETLYFQEAYLDTTITEKGLVYKDIYYEVDINEGNPKELGYYEKVGNNYELSSDTSVIPSKTYYFKDVEVDEDGEPILIEEMRKTPTRILFKFEDVNPEEVEKIQYINNVWGRQATKLIKTNSPVEFNSLTDRVMIDNKFYSIQSIYFQKNKNTKRMLSKPIFTKYISLKG